MEKHRTAIKDIVITAVLTAILTGGKLALLLITNVEIVTVLILVYAYVFGKKISLASTFIFVTIEPMLYGFNSWVISYYIYWPMLAVSGLMLAKLVKRFHGKNNENFYNLALVFSYTATAIICTAAFGVITSLVDALIGSAKTDYAVRYLFPIIYLRGVGFYLTQIISNAVIVAVCFLPLQELLQRLTLAYYGKPCDLKTLNE